MSDAPSPNGDVALPDVVVRYLMAHDRRDTESALAAFTPDARVHDDGHDYVGPDEIRYWLATASTEFTYTPVIVEATAVGTNQWYVMNTLRGTSQVARSTFATGSSSSVTEYQSSLSRCERRSSIDTPTPGTCAFGLRPKLLPAARPCRVGSPTAGGKGQSNPGLDAVDMG